MPIDFVFERAFANLVEAVKFERDAPAVGPDDAVEGNGQALLIDACNGLNGADDSCAAGDQDPLAASGIERNRYGCEDRTRKIAAELCDQNGL